MFPSLAARETYVAETNIIVLLGNKQCFCLKSKTFLFPDTNFASETYVSLFSHDENKTVSSAARSLKNSNGKRTDNN